jgi:hypothetical protein
MSTLLQAVMLANDLLAATKMVQDMIAANALEGKVITQKDLDEAQQRAVRTHKQLGDLIKQKELQGKKEVKSV